MEWANMYVLNNAAQSFGDTFATRQEKWKQKFQSMIKIVKSH